MSNDVRCRVCGEWVSERGAHAEECPNMIEELCRRIEELEDRVRELEENQ